MTLFCPCCGGPMQRYIGIFFVKYAVHCAPQARQGEYIICNMCPIVSEVDTRTGSLIDLGAITLTELLHPLEDAFTLVVAAPGRLDGRADS